MLLLKLERARNPDTFIKKFLALFFRQCLFSCFSSTKKGGQQQIWDFLNFSLCFHLLKWCFMKCISELTISLLDNINTERNINKQRQWKYLKQLFF